MHSLSSEHLSSCVIEDFPNKLEAECRPGAHQPRTHGTVFTHKADLSSEADVASLSTWLSSFKVIFDIVIHCAGVRGLVPSMPISDQASIATADSLGHMDASTMLHAFKSNALASFLFLRAILSFCRRCSPCRARSQVDGEIACSACQSATKILVLGSRCGSMTATRGGCYAYRASKAAQHAVVRSLAADAPDIIWLLCHPGRVQTGLVPVREEGAIGIEESVTDMMKLLEAAERKDSGRFVDRFGQDIPW